MHFLPEAFEQIADSLGWSPAQKRSYIAFTYVVVALYLGQLVIALRNIWVVVTKHYKEHKMLNVPAFYVFALVALSLRPLNLIGLWKVDAY